MVIHWHVAVKSRKRKFSLAPGTHITFLAVCPSRTKRKYNGKFHNILASRLLQMFFLAKYNGMILKL